jgi:uncharacterized protein YyaL (SSP411 family)
MRPLALVLAALLAVGCSGRHPAPIDPLPGAAPYPEALRERLGTALAEQPAGYRPHTRHLRPDGSPRWTNRLILESSPYLLQHAHNPVDWYPWGEEAFARARQESRPVLLSIGYSTCHWCHVMEEESFEDEEIAAYLNQHYIAIKVDREERPDLDATYMSAVQLLTGSGGWPMTVWLTPERQPFFGGTYFPARDGDRGVRTGFLTLLERADDVFAQHPLDVAEQAQALTDAMRRLATPPPGDAGPDAEVLRRAFVQFRAGFDPVHGGFGGAPKFPSPATLDFLLRWHRRTGDPEALAMVTLTLEQMAAGGIHDQIGGGFHRYATDAAWRVPHFEKMLSDNAQLATVYLEAWQATGREDFARVVRDVLDWASREMTAPGGAFYGAMDADSEGEEGRFYLWTPDEVSAVLDPGAAAAALAYWDVTEAGQVAGRSVLATPRPLAAVAADLGTDPARLAATLDAARARLRAARARRVPPHRDHKIVAAWNGLMISAFARAGAALHEPRYVERAAAAASFVLDEMRPGGHLARTWAGGASHGAGFLDDHAFLAAGLLDLHEATGDDRWLREALALHEVLAREFWDDAAGGFFTTTTDRHEDVIARMKPEGGGALPSGNAVAAENLLRLAELTGDDAHRRRAERTLAAYGTALARRPAGAPDLLAAVDYWLDRPKEIVIVTAGGDGRALLDVVQRRYVPNRVLVVADEDDLARRQALLPLLADKHALGGIATAYVCERGACKLPTTDGKVLAEQLSLRETPSRGGDGGRE